MSGRKKRMTVKNKKGAIPEINVTPLVDVVLVLLIIFMVVTPLVERELKVATPPMEQVDKPEDTPQDQLMLAVKADGTISVNDEVIPEPTLKDRLERMLAAKTDKVIFFTADDEANYEVAVNALDAAKAAGATTIGMLTEPIVDAPDLAPGAVPGVPGSPPGAVAPGAPPPPQPPATP